MAHQLDFQRGSAAFVSLKQNAWHGLGRVIETEMTVAQAITFANLDFIVKKAPNRHYMPSLSGEGMDIITSDTSFFTFRTDTNKVLGDRLGSSYHVIQNEQAFSVVDSLVNEGGLILESAGSLYDGCTVFMCLRMSNPIKVAGSDTVMQYIVIASGHDGNTSLLAFFTNTRVVCNNTLQVALKGAVQKHSIRHTAKAMNRLDEAIRIMGLATKNTKAVAEAYDRMAQREMLRHEFFDYVGNLFYTKAEIEAFQSGAKADAVLSTRKSNIVADVLHFAENGIGQKEANMQTWWGGYNAITGYFSNKKFDDANDRMDSLLFGTAAGVMQNALTLANEPEKILPLRAKASVSMMDKVSMN